MSLGSLWRRATSVADALRNATIVDRRWLHTRWEIDHLSALLAHLCVDCVFDIGANEGQYAQQLRRKVGYAGRIVSFEPNPEVAGRLRQAARGDPLWEVEEVAVGVEDGERAFNVMVASQFSSLSEPRHDEASGFESANRTARTVPVQVWSLASALRNVRARGAAARPFLKMDTQGFDVAIVRAGHDVVRDFVGLQSELAVRKLYRDSVDFRDAITLYASCGFLLSALVPNNAGHFPRLIECDGIFLRDDLV